MEFRAAKPSERDEVLALLAHWFNDAEFFARYNQNDPTFRDALCLVALDGGRMVSTVQIFDRNVNLQGNRVPMGGIGSVYTLDEYRHKGVASQLMRLAVETMEREGFEVSLLFAERLTFYNRFGWREVDRQFSVLGAAAAIHAQAGFVIDVFDEPRDLAAVAAIHRAYSGPISVASRRDIAEWRANLKFAGGQPGHPGEESEEYFIVCRRAGAGEIVAYARVAGFHGVAMVMEYGYAPGDVGIDAMLATFRYMGEAALGGQISVQLEGNHHRSSHLRGGTRAGAGLLVTQTAHDAELERRLTSAGCSPAHHTDNNYMWRVIAPDKLARRFSMDADAATSHAFEIFRDAHSLYWTSDRF